MSLEPDGYHARAIDLPAPTRDTKTMLTLLRLDLEKSPPGAPVTGFTLVAHPDRPRRAQLSLFGPAALSPEKLATTIAALVSMLGEDRVGMPMSVDGYLPERHAIGHFAPPPPPDMKRKPRKSGGLAAVRVFRPPIPVEVTTDARQITAIRGEGDLSGSVRTSSGPWPIEAEWWTENPAAREYWDVELDKGGIYRVYEGSKDAGWFVDARYE
jgi:protein ImuB